MDPWLHGNSIVKLQPNLQLPEHMLSVSAKEFITPDRTWDVATLANWLPPEIIELIRSVPIPLNTGIPDGLSWKLTANGEFST